jgi:hypothetical protein
VVLKPIVDLTEVRYFRTCSCPIKETKRQRQCPDCSNKEHDARRTKQKKDGQCSQGHRLLPGMKSCGVCAAHKCRLTPEEAMLAPRVSDAFDLKEPIEPEIKAHPHKPMILKVRKQALGDYVTAYQFAEQIKDAQK